MFESCSHEVMEFASAIKDEASEALIIQEQALKDHLSDLSSIDIKQHLKQDASDFVQVFTDSIGISADMEENDAIERSNIILGEEFLTSDHSTHPLWSDYKDRPSLTLSEAQKVAILTNDKSLGALHREIVPMMISDESFWKGWLFHRFIVANPENSSKVASRTPPGPEEWSSWDGDAHLSSKEVNSVMSLSNPAMGNNDWDEWE